MVKCSFCEQPLACKVCKQPYRPRTPEGYQGVYQSDMHILCPECQQTLACRYCGFVYGQPDMGPEA